jgi:hypothetical protein
VALISIALPPGLYANGTLYQAKGRYHAANLIRFSQDEVKPVGGWQLRSPTAAAFSGAARAVTAWTDNSQSRWIAVGAHSKLYVQDEAGHNTDITPVGFSVGLADATQNLGFGGGPYGASNFGAPRPNTVAYLPATVWTLDSWGEHLVGCSDHDGKLYEWGLNTSVKAAPITGAPTGCSSLVVTSEGFLFALAPMGNGRRVQWCDQQDDTMWTPAPTNQAGDFDLATAGVLMAGRALTGQTLLLTDVDAWTATYIGAPLVYGFQRAGTGCGLVAKGAVAALDAEAVWMGQGGFWRFNGQTAEPLDCEVADAVFGDMNPNQLSKTTAVLLGGPGEVWWFYPSGASTENDRYVAWTYRESRRLGRNIWTTGQLTRLAGAGKSVGRTPPLMTDQNGYLYEHETGLDCGGLSPFLETGPIELGQGEGLMEIQRIVPDERNAGDVEVSLTGRMWPNGPDLDLGTYSLASPTDLLAQAREVRVRFTATRKADFRIGGFRLEVVPGDGQ